MAAIAQQHDTGEVLMVAWMDAEAVRRTLTPAGRPTGRGRGRSTGSRARPVGHMQRVLEVRRDCDGDALLLTVDQTGPACHTGTRSCFDEGRTLGPVGTTG